MKRMNNIAEKTWVSGQIAQQLISEANGRTISAAYVRLLAQRGCIRHQALGKRFNLYYAPDCQRQVKEYVGKREQV
jgi:hypothetical protein